MHDWEVTGRWSLLKWNWNSFNSWNQQLEWSKWMSSCFYYCRQVFQSERKFVPNRRLWICPPLLCSPLGRALMVLKTPPPCLVPSPGLVNDTVGLSTITLQVFKRPLVCWSSSGVPQVPVALCQSWCRGHHWKGRCGGEVRRAWPLLSPPLPDPGPAWLFGMVFGWEAEGLCGYKGHSEMESGELGVFTWRSESSRETSEPFQNLKRL